MYGNSKILWLVVVAGAGYAAWAYLQAQGSATDSGASGSNGSGSGDASVNGASGSTAASDSTGLAGIAAQIGYAVGILPKGLRNHNPGNLRYVAAIPWNGQIGDDGSGYAVFDTDENGVRALGHQLGTYASRGLTSVTEIISTYAPSSENNTAAYIAAVAGELGVDPNQPLDVNGLLPQLVAAIIHHENGLQPFAPSDLQTWVYEA